MTLQMDLEEQHHPGTWNKQGSEESDQLPRLQINQNENNDQFSLLSATPVSSSFHLHAAEVRHVATGRSRTTYL